MEAGNYTQFRNVYAWTSQVLNASTYLNCYQKCIDANGKAIPPACLCIKQDSIQAVMHGAGVSFSLSCRRRKAFVVQQREKPARHTAMTSILVLTANVFMQISQRQSATITCSVPTFKAATEGTGRLSFSRIASWDLSMALLMRLVKRQASSAVTLILGLVRMCSRHQNFC